MIELLFAFLIGMVLGYCLKKEPKPPITDVLTNQVELLEESIAYYKDLCKWHVETKNESFESGRQQGMKQERALWELAVSTQELDK
jgi:hypothetical protein